MRMVQALRRLRELIEAEERVSRREQLSDYLLGELPSEEARAFEAALADDPELRAEVDRLRPVVGRLEALEPAAWEADVCRRSRRCQRARRPRGRPRRPAGPAGAAGWCCARPSPRAWRSCCSRSVSARALLAGGGDDGGGGGREVALAPVEPLGGSASGTATFATGNREAKLRLTGLPPSHGGNFYELWLLNSPDDLVSLGSFKVPASGEVDVTVPLPGGSGRFAALDVSVEPGDGNPAHSKRSVLRAPLAPS